MIQKIASISLITFVFKCTSIDKRKLVDFAEVGGRLET